MSCAQRYTVIFPELNPFSALCNFLANEAYLAGLLQIYYTAIIRQGNG